jgi:hypothetical protein
MCRDSTVYNGGDRWTSWRLCNKHIQERKEVTIAVSQLLVLKKGDSVRRWGGGNILDTTSFKKAHCAPPDLYRQNKGTIWHRRTRGKSKVTRPGRNVERGCPDDGQYSKAIRTRMQLLGMKARHKNRWDIIGIRTGTTHPSRC